MNRLDALHRVARHAAWHPLRDLVVLRGGLVMRRQIHPMPRPVDDVDFLIRVDSFDAFRAVFTAIFPTSPIEVTWAEMERPGLRTHLIVGHHEVQIDAGFGDAMVVPPARFVLRGSDVGLAAKCALVLDCVAPEQHFAWKLHGLFERGRGRWRPKDLMDLIALIRFGGLDAASVGACIRRAFLDRREDLAQIDRLARGEFGTSRNSRRRWRRFVEARTDLYGDAARVPPSHLPLIEELAGYVVPLIRGASNRQPPAPPR